MGNERDFVSFDPCAFAQELLRPTRMTITRLGPSVEAAMSVWEHTIKVCLQAVQECPTFAGRELLRMEMAKVVRLKQGILIRAVMDAKERQTLMEDSIHILRAVSAAGMACL